MNLSYRIIKDLYLSNRNFCSKDYDKAINYIKNILPNCNIKTYNNSGYNGWEIPPKWDLIEAKIFKDGELIYDATQHPLQVINLSKSFCGKVTLSELKKHLHFKTHFDLGDTAIPFHFRQNYQPWNRDWGFCIPKNIFDELQEGEYDVILRTEESQGYLDVLECVIEGENEECFYFVTHLDHPGMANDDLAGCAVGIELFKKLQESKQQFKFTYKLLIVQEIVGSGYYLGNLKGKERDQILGGVFLEAPGSETKLSLQSSLKGDSLMDKALEWALNSLKKDFRKGDFHTIIGNDEIVFEAFNIPMPSLSRFPYPEYHSDKDNIDIICPQKLDDFFLILEKTISFLERQVIFKKCFDGLVCLSNPKYDLYVDLGMQSEYASDKMKEKRKLMDLIPSLNRTFTLSDLQSNIKLSKEEISSYLSKWEEKKLILII